MTDKQLKKLNRAELLELLLEQSKEIDRLESELEETRNALAERNLKIEQCGSIADAAVELNALFRTAQRTADMYMMNVQRLCTEKAEAAGKTEEWAERMHAMEEQPAAGKAAAASASSGLVTEERRDLEEQNY